MAKKEESTQKPTSHIKPFGLRMQDELRQTVEQYASANGRSKNAEIVARLEFAYKVERSTERAKENEASQSYELIDGLLEEMGPEIEEFEALRFARLEAKLDRLVKIISLNKGIDSA